MTYDGNGTPFMKDGGNNHMLDRSKVRILLCDNNEKSSREVLRLLCKCSYQVTPVRTARQVIDALNAEGSEIDIILAEVDLPISKGLKMLKYVTRNKELHRIPIIMMSSQDEVSVVVKCLRLGAADYLVKPLRTNELLNLWTHMWRRRHMLGLAEKNIINYDFDLVASDPSDANTNSTTFLSDDTDDKSRKNTFPETSVSNQPEYMSKESATVEITIMNISKNHPNVADDQPDVSLGNITSFPRKSELKVGENSAFFSYVKSKMPVSGNSPRLTSVNANIELSLDLDKDKNQVVSGQVQDLEIHLGRQAYNDNCTDQNNLLNDKDVAKVMTSKMVTSVSGPTEFQHGCNLSNDQWTPSTHLHTRDEMNQVDKSGVPPFHFNMPFYFPQPMNHGIVQSTAHCYQASFDGVAKHSSSSLMPQFGGSIHPQYPHGHMHMMGSFAYYPPVPAGGQPGQVASIPQLWPPAVTNTSSSDVKTVRIERREAALMKFRQKRKDRCFDKKIRYVNRKRLADRRPRVRGQFVRQTNGVNVDLNGRPAIDDDSEDEEDDDDEEEYASEY